MNGKNLSLLRYAIIGISLVMPISAAFAQALPGSADVSRIKPEEKLPVPDHSLDEQTTVPNFIPATPIPEGAKTIHFTLKAVKIEGMTAFSQVEMADIYTPYLDREITLDVAYVMAGQITERYRQAGYFLSLAYVPNQNIKDGTITLHVVEGYVSQVGLPEEVANHHIIRDYIDRLTAIKPVTSSDVERFLLQLNDLPGYSFRAVLSPAEHSEEGAAKLTLVPAKKEGKGMVTFDNFSSRYLGPNEAAATYSTSLLPLQQTTISGLSSLPFDRLHYGTLDHVVPIAPDIALEFTAGITKAYPGYTLERFDIDSKAISESLCLNYQWIRQRQQNLALKLLFDRRDIESDILHTPLTRDHIRAIRATATYDASDSWSGKNMIGITLSQGINGLGASQKADLNISRAGAIPDFTKFEFSLSRLQGITKDWSLFANASGQWTTATLYSSEQFGYGGQAFGRAYDASDITGDKGADASLELRYSGLNALVFSSQLPVNVQTYAFYDIGTVWNDTIGQQKRESGASAGFGFRFVTDWHQNGNLGLAWPLTRPISTPIYGGTSQGPRIVLQISQEF